MTPPGTHGCGTIAQVSASKGRVTVSRASRSIYGILLLQIANTIAVIAEGLHFGGGARSRKSIATIQIFSFEPITRSGDTKSTKLKTESEE
jgi:phage tail sheath protein FI